MYLTHSFRQHICFRKEAEVLSKLEANLIKPEALFSCFLKNNREIRRKFSLHLLLRKANKLLQNYIWPNTAIKMN